MRTVLPAKKEPVASAMAGVKIAIAAVIKVAPSMRRNAGIPPMICPPALPCKRARMGRAWREARPASTDALKLVTFALFGGDVRLLRHVLKRERRSCI